MASSFQASSKSERHLPPWQMAKRATDEKGCQRQIGDYCVRLSRCLKPDSLNPLWLSFNTCGHHISLSLCIVSPHRAENGPRKTFVHHLNCADPSCQRTAGMVCLIKFLPSQGSWSTGPSFQASLKVSRCHVLVYDKQEDRSEECGFFWVWFHIMSKLSSTLLYWRRRKQWMLLYLFVFPQCL